MANYIHTQGPTTILVASGKSSNTTGTTAYAGESFRIHPEIGRLAFSFVFTGTSAVSTGAVTCVIEGSNDGTNWVSTALLSETLSLTTDTMCQGGPMLTTMAGQWGYIRARVTSMTTATGGSSGNPAGQNAILTVLANAGYQGKM